MEPAAFLQALEAGGNVALIAIAYAIYRLDRRLYAVELRLEGCCNGVAHKTNT